MQHKYLKPHVIIVNICSHVGLFWVAFLCVFFFFLQALLLGTLHPSLQVPLEALVHHRTPVSAFLCSCYALYAGNVVLLPWPRRIAFIQIFIIFLIKAGGQENMLDLYTPECSFLMERLRSSRNRPWCKKCMNIKFSPPCCFSYCCILSTNPPAQLIKEFIQLFALDIMKTY